MAGKAFLGVDAGTSIVKAAIFDENGDALAVGTTLGASCTATSW